MSFMKSIMALTVLVVCSQASAQSPAEKGMMPGLYAIKTLPDGRPYLGSDLIPYGRDSMLSSVTIEQSYLLDKAQIITETEIKHVPTQMVFPIDNGTCHLTRWMGLRNAELPGWKSFEKGGAAIYGCRPDTGVAFLIVTFETSFPRTENHDAKAFGKHMIYLGMQRPKGEDTLTCQHLETPALFNMDCSMEIHVEERAVVQRGRFSLLKNGFVKINYACLKEDCATADKAVVEMEKQITGAD